jgi:hypothetical protein
MRGERARFGVFPLLPAPRLVVEIQSIRGRLAVGHAKKAIALLVLVVGFAWLRGAERWGRAAASPCPPGYKPLSDDLGGRGPVGGRPCIAIKHPEPPFEVELRQREMLALRSAPYSSVAPGALRAAIAERERLAKSGPKVNGTAGSWTPYGTGPLVSNHPAFSSVNGLGLVYEAGRIDDLKHDPATGRLFAVKGTGGIWLSEDLGDTWRSIGDRLPSQIVGALGFSAAGGGTLVALSGDPTFGGGGYTGFGAFYSTDLGASWQRATGIPDGALGFAVEVDPLNPAVVHAGTSVGLFRSTDGGRSYVNVVLPTGSCAGVEGGTTGRPECQLANIVTDVVIKTPGGVNGNPDVPPGTVVAAVGWRGGRRRNSDGSVQSEGNGFYRSTTGEPGTFVRLAATGFTSPERIGRIELGPTTGPLQDHDYLYAIVQDAVALNGGIGVVDVPLSVTNPLPGTVLNGIYVSADFGATWTLMADDNAIAKNPASGSALFGTGTALGFEPGVQAWYNEWILPDPTRQDLSGIPTRLAFGLEEVWQNELPVPLAGPTSFKVIGRYFSDKTCLLLGLGLPECPTHRPPTTSTTTHPDQHAAVWIPDGAGGVTLAVGNDGGFYRNHVAAGQELDNGGWGDGNQTGFNTLLPYDVAIAKDGTVWAGLQDNGHIKIVGPAGAHLQTFGGDGTFAEVDPDNSDVAYEATPFADMRVTTDGGKSWTSMAPPITNPRFINPFEMDPLDARHLVTAGREVVETVFGPATGSSEGEDWVEVYNLGTAQHPGDPAATASATDPANGMSAIDVQGDAVYVGFCGRCDILNAVAPFKRGIATNLGGAEPPERMTSKGWHIASANGLPNRYITSIAIDPRDVRTVYVTLGGYSRRWVPPGTLQDDNDNVGVGHLFKSTDAGETFVDVSGNLPDVPATWVTLRRDQLIVGTDVGVFASDVKGGTTFAPLLGLPVVPIATMMLKPDDPNLLVAATYGRGIWAYRFAKALPGTKDDGGGTDIEFPGAPVGAVVAGPFGFELGDDGWTTSATTLTTFWRRGSPGHASATAFQIAPYTDESTASLTSPPLSQPGGWVFVDFRNRRDTEPGFDFMHLEWSADDGASWSSAPWFFVGGQWSRDFSMDGRNASYPAFDLVQAAFKAPAGGIRIRFRFSSDALISAPLFEGVAVDEVRIHR